MKSVWVVLIVKAAFLGILLFISILLVVNSEYGLPDSENNELTVISFTESVTIFIITVEFALSVSSFLRGVYIYRKDKIIRREIAVYLTFGLVVGVIYFYYRYLGTEETKRLWVWTGLLLVVVVVQIGERVHARHVLRRIIDETIFLNQRAGNFIDEEGAAALYEIQLRRKVFARYGSSPYESSIKNVLHVEYHQLMVFAAHLERLARREDKNLFVLDEIRREMICHVRSFGLSDKETEKWRKIADAPLLIFPDID
ncbi:unnamed protein product [Bursaphelenchus xylophilus]|uniref:(pine wood nematode) hypothetical protein n=1 Tax=Bursaphelenchus xylophilus TaxID=6326 RepID=A0A1I7S447_BURXY|nr:unnamed protein product [Bursaphelenchus xylophilus]CAG9116718.1 unnamed protein product [Bursaphelenchus xylophilus]